jgi:hypothetical protein
MTEPVIPATATADEQATVYREYFQRLFPGAGNLAIEHMVRLRLHINHESWIAWQIIAAALGETTEHLLGGPPLLDPVREVAVERDKLLDALIETRQSRDEWFTRHEQAANRLREVEAKLAESEIAVREMLPSSRVVEAEAEATKWKTRLVDETARLRAKLDEAGRPATLLREFIEWMQRHYDVEQTFSDSEVESLTGEFLGQRRAERRAEDAPHNPTPGVALGTGWSQGGGGTGG